MFLGLERPNPMSAVHLSCRRCDLAAGPAFHAVLFHVVLGADRFLSAQCRGRLWSNCGCYRYFSGGSCVYAPHARCESKKATLARPKQFVSAGTSPLFLAPKVLFLST